MKRSLIAHLMNDHGMKPWSVPGSDRAKEAAHDRYHRLSYAVPVDHEHDGSEEWE